MASAQAMSRASRYGLIYPILIAFAAFYLTPMVVVVLNSLRSFEEITQTSVLGFPQTFRWNNWAEAWGGYCIGGICAGISPYMWNSLVMTLPATILSTLLGALNGYVLSLWRFKGSNLLFGIITFGVFLPAQMKLVPWAITLRQLDLSNTVSGLVLIHVIQGMSFTTLFCRNYYVNIPPDLIKAARVDGAGFLRIFWRIILPLSPPILIVTVIWQFTNIWNEFLYGITFSEGANRPVTAALMALNANIAQAREYGIESAAVLLAALPTLLVYLFGGKYFMRGLTAGSVK
jgi:glucose/mannose transport system permease protein